MTIIDSNLLLVLEQLMDRYKNKICIYFIDYRFQLNKISEI